MTQGHVIKVLAKFRLRFPRSANTLGVPTRRVLRRGQRRVARALHAFAPARDELPGDGEEARGGQVRPRAPRDENDDRARPHETNKQKQPTSSPPPRPTLPVSRTQGVQLRLLPHARRVPRRYHLQGVSRQARPSLSHERGVQGAPNARADLSDVARGGSPSHHALFADLTGTKSG